MKVVILYGGKGTRRRDATEFRPKPMVPIGSQGHTQSNLTGGTS